MKRIDSVNARPNVNGTGKTGFSDNADLFGQDATYLTPDWLNHLQEELCNLLELNGTPLNTNSKQQLFDLLTTQSELVALSDAIESNFIRKSQKGVAGGVAPLNTQSIIDSTFLPISSLLKAGIVQLVNDLTIGGTDKALSAEQGKILLANMLGVNQTWQDLKTQRSNNVTYTNTTGKPIQVFMAINDTNGAGYNLTIDGIVAGGASDLSAGLYYPFSFIVPNGSTYKIYWAAGANSQILFWLELR